MREREKKKIKKKTGEKEREKEEEEKGRRDLMREGRWKEWKKTERRKEEGKKII